MARSRDRGIGLVSPLPVTRAVASKLLSWLLRGSLSRRGLIADWELDAQVESRRPAFGRLGVCEPNGRRMGGTCVPLPEFIRSLAASPSGSSSIASVKRGFASRSSSFASDGVSWSSEPRKASSTVQRRNKGPYTLAQSRPLRFREAAAQRAAYDARADTSDPSHRWKRIQAAKFGDWEKKPKKKKRPPPGPRQFEDLTAKKPVHSDLPFDFKHSYTETPIVTPVIIREQFSPFGPNRLDREWNGISAVRRPDPKPEKTTQKPGAFRGQGPRIAISREEILGEPLIKEEQDQLIEHCIKSSRQVNIGRDGLTHNMLIVIHHHWRREQAIRIKCKGVCTVDMENVCFQIEDKTGGKILKRVGGTVYLFSGRNYNHKYISKIPMMLWKPHSPLYPRLIKKKPADLTLEEANGMKKRGLKIMPLCKLAKNGYYGDLVQNVREAFEDDELVRINCKGLNTSDYKKIGAKLRDLVPCILLSFQREQIIVWRGRDWKSLETQQMGEFQDSEATNTSSIGDSGDLAAVAASDSLVKSVNAEQRLELDDPTWSESEKSDTSEAAETEEASEVSASDTDAQTEVSELSSSNRTAEDETDFTDLYFTDDAIEE